MFSLEWFAEFGQAAAEESLMGSGEEQDSMKRARFDAARFRVREYERHAREGRSRAQGTGCASGERPPGEHQSVTCASAAVASSSASARSRVGGAAELYRPTADSDSASTECRAGPKR